MNESCKIFYCMYVYYVLIPGRDFTYTYMVPPPAARGLPLR